jgi:2-C-methyl-D-erythritol 4-phosphate cytidylyltransferase
MKTAAIIVAAGSAERFGGKLPKQFKEVHGQPLLARTISRFEEAASIDSVIVAVAEEYLRYTSEHVIDPYGFQKVHKVVAGGDTRQQSVLKSLEALPISTEYVAIHDAARPLVTPSDIDRVVAQAHTDRAAILGIPVPDTVKRVRGGYVLATLNREFLYLTQTPQVFQYDLIIKVHREAAELGNDASVTDDAALMERLGFKVTVVEPSGPNFKVTTRQDFELVEALLAGGSQDA